jgi:AcrR family transcriptional regulator
MAPSAAPSAARSPKGERTLRAVLDAARAIVAEEGTAGVSQENVARRAGISQSALRHYLPTKDELLRALFDDVLQGHRASFERIVLEPGASAAVRITRIVNSHLDVVATMSDATMLEVFAFWARHQEARASRHEFHGWLVGHYSDAVQVLRPELSTVECREIGFQVLTLGLGAWLTLGRSRPLLLGSDAARVKLALRRGVDALVGVRLPW